MSIYSTQDEGRGLTRLCWKDKALRDLVFAANPEFAALLDELDPGNIPFYTGYYPYGAALGDDKTTFLPTLQGDFLALNEVNNPRFSRELLNDLGYGMHSAPLCLILDKSVELFIDRKEDNVTLPYRLLHAGDFISTKRILSGISLGDNMAVSGSAGCRSAIMLPPLGCSRHFTNVRHAFDMDLRKPTSLYEHGLLFAQLAQHPAAGCDWKMKVVFFSNELVEIIKHKLQGQKISLYLHRYAIKKYLSFSSYEAYIMSLTLTEVLRRQKIKVDPYFSESVQHFYKVAAGHVPGFAPASNETYLPWAFLQRIAIDIYKMPLHYPTILHPSNFDLDDNSTLATYCSRQYPTTFSAPPKTRNAASVTYEMSEQQNILNELDAGLSALTPNSSNASCLRIVRKVEFCTYHSHNNKEKNLKLSGCLPSIDPRFGEAGCAFPLEGRYMSDEGAFTRGCVAIRLKKQGAVDKISK